MNKSASATGMCNIIAGLVLVLVVALTVSCTNLPSNIGKSREVVIASSVIDSNMIVDNIQIFNYVPQKEGLFTLLFKADTEVKMFNRYHTILIYGSLQDKAISTLLSEEAKVATQKDTFTLFKLNDLWAREQLVIVMAASEPVHVTRGIIKYKNMINNILEENYYQHIKKSYYYKNIDNKNKEALKHFGVVFDITKSWLIDSTHQEDNFIFFHTHFPDRSIFFYKERITQQLSRPSAIEKRDELTDKYYSGDYVLEDLVTSEEIEFKDMKGIKLRGVWQNDSLVAGGPFISYFLIDEDTLYVIDGMLFSPGKRKSDHFMIIEVIMNSFHLVKAENKGLE